MINTLYKDYECLTGLKDKLVPYSVVFKISFEKYGKIFESKIKYQN